MTARVRIAIVVAAILVATVAARWIHPLTAIGDIKSDEATYVSMALSLAHDGNLTFEKADLDRFVAIYPRGPEGIFLKREYAIHPAIGTTWPFVHLNRTELSTSDHVAYGKSFAYAVAAAPFALLGGVGGLLVFNIAILLLCIAGAIRFAQAQAGRVTGAMFGSVFFVASVVPVYVFWFMPEIFNVALIFGAYFLWLYKEVAPATAWRGWRGRWTDAAAAMLIGIAVFSKPTHAVLILPMLFAAAATHQWRRAVVIGAIGAAVGGGLFAANLALTGDWSYQGAPSQDLTGRKQFYDAYPFDSSGTTFDAYEHVSVTNDTGDVDTTTRDKFVRLLPINAWYFIVGRDAGLLPFFCPGLVIFVVWLLRAPRATVWQVGTVLGMLATIAAFLIIAPYSWNGDGGPPGNRYILSSYPVLLFLIPRGMTVAAPILAAVVGWAFTAPILWSPLRASYLPWKTVEGEPFRSLPVELTMATSLPAELNGPAGGRHRIDFSKDPEIIFTYLDPNASGLECGGPCAKGALPDRQWIAGDATADILIRTEQPLTKLTLEISGKYVPNDVKVSLVGVTKWAHLDPGGSTTMVFTPSPGVWAHASWGVILRISTTNGFVPALVEPVPPGSDPDRRNLGVLVKYSFEVAKPPAGG